MASSTTSAVYIHVIEDVINKVRDEFINNGGPGESVLNELQGIWEMKMMQVGAILGPIEKKSSGVRDLNEPYEGPEEYETPTAEMLFPPTPSIQTPLPGTAQTPLPGTAQTPLPGTAQTPLFGQTPLPGTADSSLYNIPTGGTPITPNEFSSGNDPGSFNELKAGRPNPYMQPPASWMNQRPLSVDVNVAYEEGREEVDRGTSQQTRTQDFFTMPSGKRKREDFVPQYYNGGYIPQQDGAGDAISNDFQALAGVNIVGNIASAANRGGVPNRTRLSSKIPQLDGPVSDPYDDVLSTPNIYNYQGVVNEDYNIASTPAPNDHASTPAIISQNDVVDDDEDEPLNENDDDDLDDGDQGEELNTQHLVLAQFDKVTRTKSRWKCTLKDGIMHINNKDILFNKATGEFDF